jgi:hypothetical protein
MKFRTEINPKPSNHKIDYASSVLLFGSCFSNHIGAKLNYYKFKVFSNPFGVIFQPKAIEKLPLQCVNESVFTDENLLYHNERWHCLDTHSDVSFGDKSAMIQHLNHLVSTTHQQVKNASHLIITLGTAWVYRYLKTKKYVANCHKIPQKEFKKELLSISHISESLQSIINSIQKINPSCHVIFTVSPVRHIKDGMVENSLSKAHLISAVHSVVRKNENTRYFPSYELLLDDLRDYRFFKEDLIHPNAMAVDYIWNKFMESDINPSCKIPMKLVEEVQKGLNHQPFNEESEGHQKFLKSLENKKDRLKAEFDILF